MQIDLFALARLEEAIRMEELRRKVREGIELLEKVEEVQSDILTLANELKETREAARKHRNKKLKGSRFREDPTYAFWYHVKRYNETQNINHAKIARRLEKHSKLTWQQAVEIFDYE